ncbi:MAG: thioredoxin family protein [Leptolyngbyaceae cyanobacterium RU_5_1]|nr:thioredoxin family protein [Leptolyngbyaceae cyanobacterium RU_5_1]
MTCSWLRLLSASLMQGFNWRRVWVLVLSVVLTVGSLTAMNTPSAIAALTDDRYDGDIFALYGGNGSIVPPRVTLAQAFNRKHPILLVLYVDDSSDCKEYTTVISQLQSFYGRVTDIIPIRVDAIPPKSSYAPTEPGYYYNGVVPQTVVFNESGNVVLNQKGVLAFEQVDDVFRKVYDLLPRSQSVELKRRPVNEINTELVQQ